MSGVALVLHQFRFDQKVFWRNRASVFFTALFPLMFLFMLATVFNNANIDGLGVTAPPTTCRRSSRSP